jgi:NADH-quinone oxidoreductase subunit A
VQAAFLPVLLFVGCVVALALGLLAVGNLVGPSRPGRVKQMPYESGMDPVHDTRRRFDVRFHLLAIAFLVFDVELLFLYPWAVAVRRDSPPATLVTAAAAKGVGPAGGAESPLAAAAAPSPRPLVRPVFVGGIVFLAILALGFVYDWRKGVFLWR